MGGYLANGRFCSPVNFNCNNAPSNSNWNRASRNFYNNQKINTSAYLIPCRLAKIVDTAGVSKRIYILPRIPETIKKNGEQMRSFNIDSKVKDREIIQRAITKICKKKKKKKNTSNRKYKPATASSFMSRIGALKHCNSRNFYKKNIKPFADIKQLKEVISNEIRKHSNAQFAI